MTTQPTRSRVKSAALTLCGIAAVAAAVGTASVPAAAAGRPQPPLGTAAAAAHGTVVINCARHAQTRPGRYILTCADANSYLARLRWAAWRPSRAFGDGVSTFNDCVPDCAAGDFHSFRALVALWRAEPRPGPGHAGERYFSRLTIIYTGRRGYRAGGKRYHLPLTVTEPLSPAGGV
jgi:hypothetical protein